MNTFLLAPDSFKGTLSAAEVCEIQAAVIRSRLPDAQIRALPLSDGGEGMVRSFLQIVGGQEVTVSVTGPLGEAVDAVYGLLPDGSAIMEMAAAAGLPLVGNAPNPLRSSTFGVGEMLLDAASRGVKKVLMGLGGSATNDCGIGMAAALGFRFLDKSGHALEPLAANLGRICAVEPPHRLPELELSAACDVNNPLLGPTGATYTFGPQKGADADTLERLESGMAHFAAILAKQYGDSGADTPGAGAAGGMGAAILTLLGGSLRPGIELLLDAAGFDTLLTDADVVLTGEGRIDWQSARGKVPAGVGQRCKRAGVPCLALCGSVGAGVEAVYDCGITAVFSAVKGAATFSEIQKTCREDLAFLTDAVLRTLAAL